MEFLVLSGIEPGKLHPVLVHLPIGFIILAVLLEAYAWFKKTGENSAVIVLSWFVATLSALAAAVAGWMLASGGHYFPEHIFWHRWLGVLVVIFTAATWLGQRYRDRIPKQVHWVLVSVLVVLLTIEGHLGGIITHGEGYLLPVIGISRPIDGKHHALAEQDSVEVYTDLIRPILQQKCFSCHNSEQHRGGLNMEDTTAFKEGGINGPVLSGPLPSDSELMSRVSLPADHPRFMPPDGVPLTYDELKVIEWWVSEGAPFAGIRPAASLPEELGLPFMRLYQLDSRVKPWYSSVYIAAADSTLLKKVEDAGFHVRSLGIKNPLLDIRFPGEKLEDSHIQLLSGIGQHITWLSLAGTQISETGIREIGSFANLTRLNLEKSSVEDAGLSHLASLNHLESINLYGTAVSDASVPTLAGLKALKRIYLWNTSVSAKGLQELKESRPDLEVITSVQ